jgi:hypothetical protein
VIVPLVGIGRVVRGVRRAVWHVLFRVNRPHRAHVVLVAGGTGRALVGVHIQQAVAEDCHRVLVRHVCVLDGAAASLVLREQHPFRHVQLVDALHGADVDARPILHVDARLGDDRDP